MDVLIWCSYMTLVGIGLTYQVNDDFDDKYVFVRHAYVFSLLF